MPAKKYLRIPLILVLLFIAAIANPVVAQETATSTTTPTPQAVTMVLTIFRDADSLTIYVPRRQEYSSLTGITLQVTTSIGQQIIKRLESDFAAFLGMPFNDMAMLTPVCFRLVRSGGNVPAPQACQGTTLNLTEFLFAGDVFWRDTSANQDRLLLLMKDGQPIGVCPPGQAQCEIAFILLLPTATATPTVTDIPTVTTTPAPTESLDPTISLIPSPSTSIPTLTLVFQLDTDAPLATVANRPFQNVRSGPTTVSEIIGQLNEGDTVPILATNHARTWVFVLMSNGKQGWMSASLIEITGDLNTVPRIAPETPITATSTASQ